MKAAGLTLTCTSPVFGVGVGSSPLYRFSAGPAPSLIKTARILLSNERVTRNRLCMTGLLYRLGNWPNR